MISSKLVHVVFCILASLIASPGGYGSFTYTYWYAPQVERWVKYIFEDSRPVKLALELLETNVK